MLDQVTVSALEYRQPSLDRTMTIRPSLHQWQRSLNPSVSSQLRVGRHSCTAQRSAQALGELTHSWLIPDRAIVPLSRALVEGALTVTAFDERDARQLEPGNMWGRVAFSTFSWSSLGYSLQSTGPSSASSQRVMRAMRCLVTELVTG